jgi:hypothetical protein
MDRFRTSAGALVSTLALGSLAATAVPAFADGGSDVPCATQQAHVDRATANSPTSPRSSPLTPPGRT